MSFVATARRYLPLPSLDGERNWIRDGWDRLSGVPGGKRIFSLFIDRAVPYTATIRPQIESLALGHAVVSMADRPGVRNHLRSVHAIALANLAELTGNLAISYSLPEGARFIVAGMSLEYLKKARGTIRGESHCPVPESAERREYQVPVVLCDAEGVEVVRATLRTLVGPVRRSPPPS